MEIKSYNLSINLQEYLIKGKSQPKIPNTRFFLITKYPPLDNFDLLERIFNTHKGRCKSKEFINHIIWALRFNSVFPTETPTESVNNRNLDNFEEFFESTINPDRKKEEEFLLCYKFSPIYFWGFSFIWRNSNESTRKNSFKNYECLWEKDDFDTVKLWSSFIYEMVINRINKYIYKKIRNQITLEERRLFLFYYTRKPLSGYKAINQDRILKGFPKLPEVAELIKKMDYHLYTEDMKKGDSPLFQ